MTRVFVYGTLKRGQGNHHLINQEPEATIIAELPFRMISLGGFPALIPSDGTNYQIVGEVYSVDKDTFARLDRLEGYPQLYDRMQMDLKPFGIDDKAWFYYMRLNNGYMRSVNYVESGNWNR